MEKETAGQMLERLGTDAMAWAREFVEQYPDVDLLGGPLKDDATGVMVGWFANAMAMAERAGYDAGMMAQAGMVPPDTSASDTAWDSRNHPDRVADYVPCGDAALHNLMHPYDPVPLPAAQVSGNSRAPSDEIAKRMEALVRALAESRYGISLADEARAIVALLPEPVDADLVEARSIIADAFRDYSGDEGDDSARMVEEGKMDDGGSVKRIVDYARRLRALERDSREG